MKWILTCWVLPGGCKTAGNLSGSHSPWSVLEINLDLQGNYLHSLAWESSSDPLKPPVLLPLGRRTRSSSNTIIAPRPSLTMWQFWNGGKSKLQRSCSEEKHLFLKRQFNNTCSCWADTYLTKEDGFQENNAGAVSRLSPQVWWKWSHEEGTVLSGLVGFYSCTWSAL